MVTRHYCVARRCPLDAPSKLLLLGHIPIFGGVSRGLASRRVLSGGKVQEVIHLLSSKHPKHCHPQCQVFHVPNHPESTVTGGSAGSCPSPAAACLLGLVGAHRIEHDEGQRVRHDDLHGGRPLLRAQGESCESSWAETTSTSDFPHQLIKDKEREDERGGGGGRWWDGTS